jgi:hypothetical protein
MDGQKLTTYGNLIALIGLLSMAPGVTSLGYYSENTIFSDIRKLMDIRIYPIKTIKGVTRILKA